MTKTRPLVSVGVPVYNCEQFISKTLDALVAQSYKNLEIVISDNASTDGTGAICLDYAAKDPRVRYHRNSVNIGLLGNFRRAFELSSGDYFTWTAADDFRPPTAIEACVEALARNSRAVMAHGPILVETPSLQEPVARTNEMDLSSKNVAERIRAFTEGIKHNAMEYGLYRRDALAKGTYGGHYGTDYLICLQMCFLGPIEYVRTPMIIYRERTLLPSEEPVYEETPLTLQNLLNVGGARRRKCWTVLLMGCYYFATIRSVDREQRWAAIRAHVATFTRLYRSRLVKEAVFQLFAPIALLNETLRRSVRRWPVCLRLARRVGFL